MPPCSTHQAGSEQHSRVAWVGPCGDALLEGLVSSWPIPIFPHTWLGLEHSLLIGRLGVQDFRAGKDSVFVPMPRSFLL